MARKKSLQKQARATRQSYTLRPKSKDTLNVKAKPRNTEVKRKRPERQNPPTSDKGQNVEQQQCTICLNTNNFKQCKTMECGHAFHTRCINSWLRVSASCPICRNPVKKRQSPKRACQQCPLATPQGTTAQQSLRTQQNLPHVTFHITVFTSQIDSAASATFS